MTTDTMAAITVERERITQRIARDQAQLEELTAAERVLSRFTKTPKTKDSIKTKTPTKPAASTGTATRRKRGRPASTKTDAPTAKRTRGQRKRRSPISRWRRPALGLGRLVRRSLRGSTRPTRCQRDRITSVPCWNDTAGLAGCLLLAKQRAGRGTCRRRYRWRKRPDAGIKKERRPTPKRSRRR